MSNLKWNYQKQKLTLLAWLSVKRTTAQSACHTDTTERTVPVSRGTRWLSEQQLIPRFPRTYVRHKCL